MNIEEINVYKCSDGKIFQSEREAIEYQNNLALTAIDKVMKNYSKEKPDIHYPNLSLTLIPFMNENSEELINALKLSCCIIY